MNDIQKTYKIAGDIEEYVKDRLEVKMSIDSIDNAINKLYGCNSSIIHKAKTILMRAYNLI